MKVDDAEMRRRLLTEQGSRYSRPEVTAEPNNAVAFAIAIAIGVAGGMGAHYVSAAGTSVKWERS